MNVAGALLAYATLIGLAAPRLLLRGTWSYRTPALAIAAWLASLLSFTFAVALAAFHLAAPTEHLHAGLVSLLHSCGLAPAAGNPDPGIKDKLAVALPAFVVLLLLGLFIAEVLRGRRLRSRHRYILDAVGRHSERWRATILEHDQPAVYCLPGRRSRVVVSDGALRQLSTEQLAAVLEHERAHIAGRHHLVLAIAQAFARAFPWLPLARHAREQTALLLEMIADDRALRRHSHDVLATAMYEMAAGGPPQGAFGVGGSGALIRLRRVLARQPEPHPALSASMAVASAALPLVPLVVGCALSLGSLPR
ncbi:M56 family metallopeptidase [Streptomyces mayteni]